LVTHPFSIQGIHISIYSRAFHTMFDNQEGRRFRLGPFIITLVAAIFSLGAADIPRHTIGNWQAMTNYLTTYGYTLPGADPASSTQLNSCSVATAPSLQCNGNGRCTVWFSTLAGQAGGVGTGATSTIDRLSFCKCDAYWADPECRTPRASQQVAFFLSMFTGMFGVDQFYMGYPLLGVMKLLSLGGGGVWYIFDVIRIGSTPVISAKNFKLEADLPHGVFVLCVIVLMGAIGFFFAVRGIKSDRAAKAREILLLKAQSPGQRSTPGMGGPGMYGSNRFHGYGTTINGAA